MRRAADPSGASQRGAEDSAADQDYYLTAEAIDMLERDGADPQLVGVLRRALAGSDGMEVRWTRE